MTTSLVGKVTMNVLPLIPGVGGERGLPFLRGLIAGIGGHHHYLTPSEDKVDLASIGCLSSGA
jgi:hypothetical protein